MEEKVANNQNQSGQGQVKNPENDGRMKENKGGSSGQRGSSSQSGKGQGEVKGPKNDGRMKENRDR
jgi:hypothetical protein